MRLIFALRFLSDEGVISVTGIQISISQACFDVWIDFLPRKKTHQGLKPTNHPLQNWLIRRVEVCLNDLIINESKSLERL